MSYLPDLGLGDLAAAEAGRTDAHAPVARLRLSAHWAQIDVPAPLGDIVRVADVVAKPRPFAADLTNLCHELLQKNCQTGWVNVYFS